MSPFMKVLFTFFLLLLVKYGGSKEQTKGVAGLLHENALDGLDFDDLFEEFDKEDSEFTHSKRGLGTLVKVGGKVLFGASILTSALNIGYSAWMANKGCCTQMKFCSQQDELSSSIGALKKKLNDRDAVAGDGKKKGNWVLGIHNNNEILRLKIQSILDSVDQILTLLDIDTKNKFEGYVTEFEQTLDGRRDEVSQWTDNELEYTNMWGTTAGRLMLFGPLFLELGIHGAGKMWKRYKIGKIKKALGAELSQSIMKNTKSRYGLKGMVVTGGKSFTTKGVLSKTAHAKYQAQQSKATKAAGGLVGALSAVSIAADLFEVFKQQKECARIRDIVLDKHRAYLEKKKTIDDDIEKIKTYNEEIDESYVNLTASLRTEDFKQSLELIKTMVNEAQNPKKDISDAITDFINKIGAAEKQQIVDIQEVLTKKVSKVQFTYQCYVKKARILKNLERSCKNGDKTFDEIYAPLFVEEKFGECKADGVPYFTKDKSKEVIAKAFQKDNEARGTSKSINCRLNGQFASICSGRCEGYTTSDIVKRLKNNHGIKAEPEEVDAIDCKNFICHLDASDRQLVCREKGEATEPMETTAKRLLKEEQFPPALLSSIKCAVCYSRQMKLEGRNGPRGCRGHFKLVEFSENKYKEYCKQVSPSVTSYKICEGGNLGGKKLECPEGKTIRIQRALYGRTSKVVCPTSDGKEQPSNCPSSLATIDGARKRCDHKRTCDLRASNEDFGDPCYGVTKYLDVAFICVAPQTSTVESPPSMGIFSTGRWSGYHMCPEGKKVTGYQLRIHAYSSREKDNTAVNGIQLRCEGGTVTKPITGNKGNWVGWAVCPSNGPISSVRVRSDAPAPPRRRSWGCRWWKKCETVKTDRMGVMDVTATCAGSGAVLSGKGVKTGGTLLPPRSCPTGAYICGVQALVSPHHVYNDDLAITRLQLKCCKKVESECPEV